MTLEYTLKLDLKVQHINNKTQKIDNFPIETFGIVLVNFQIKNKQDPA